MAEPLNWDEFRIVRAIAEAQSLSGAAGRLGLNSSTLFRRLAAMETRLGVKLFERERSGYRRTAAGEDMVALASLMGDMVAEFERRVTRSDLMLSGRVRVTTLNSLGALVMPGVCAALNAAHPALQVELLLTESSLDLLHGEADIAVRCLKQAPQSPLLGRRWISRCPWDVYATAALIDAAGEPLANCPWVAPSEHFGPPAARRWVERHVESWRRAATASNDIVMAELAARGVGASLLPGYVAVTRPELRPLHRTDLDLDSEFWILATESALRSPRVRAAFDFLGDELARRRAWLEGERVVDT